jgi:DNA-binding response OmpR family regulator
VITENENQESTSIWYVIGFFFILIPILISVWKKRVKTTTNPNLIKIGSYFFDKKNTELLIEDQKIELTSKEADLLLLLFKDVNNTIERDVILNVVWGDEGDYIGRTLDVFISKLRKKLDSDPNIKIVNIRGVGYKLVLDL